MRKQLYFFNKKFEQEVRDYLGVFDGPIYTSDIASVKALDLSNFSFDPLDVDALTCFSNLRELIISCGMESLDFLMSFSKLESLSLEYWSHGNTLDFRVFSCLDRLTDLWVTGGDISSIKLVNLDALIGLKNLRTLHLHEFGCVDLLPLCQMPWLTDFFCGYANTVRNADAIGSLKRLESLCMIDCSVDDISFLGGLPESLELEMIGIEVRNQNGLNVLNRFPNREVCEITVDGKMVIW